MAFIRENMPEVAARMDQVKSSDPEVADRLNARIGPRVAEIMALQEREPEFARLKSDELANGLALIDAFKQARDARDDPEKLKAARATLAARVADQFEIRTRLRQREIEKLRGRLDRLESELQEQVGHRDQDIQKSVDDMMSGKAPMDVLGDGPGRMPRKGDRAPSDGAPPDGDPPPPGEPPPGPR
jgi:hypothetical protein